MKMVINTSYEHYCLSPKAYEYLGLEWDFNGYAYYGDRTNPKLISCIETLGEEASWCGSKLRVVDVPDDVDLIFERDDCKEWIAEKHRTWGK